MTKRSDRRNTSHRKTSGDTDVSLDRFVDWLSESSGQTVSSRSPSARLFEEPSPEALTRYATVPLVVESRQPPQYRTGRVAYDSWAHGPAPARRDITDGHIRRLRLQAGTTVVEIVAERRDNQWEFVARAYSGGDVAHDFVLKIGRKKLLAKTGGFFHWSSRLVPRAVELLSYRHRIVFGELSW